MTVTVIQLQEYVGTKETGQFMDDTLATATLLVKRFVGTANVPPIVIDQAILNCASELYHRRSAPNGISQFADFNGAAIRVARDPMTSTYPLLQPFVGYGV